LPRLDQALVERGLVPTRSRARDLIVRGLVRVDGAAVTKAGAVVALASAIELAPQASGYVSRAAEKLVAGLDRFAFVVAGGAMLDIGASTGGFTEILLERRAQRVYAVDVGHGQLHPRIAGDARVVVLERTDARDLSRALVPDAVSGVVADVSFISLTKALSAALALAAPGAWLIALVKPQFEAGPDHVGKGGIVRDEVVRARVLDDAVDWVNSRPGWAVSGTLQSPITGGSGNVEYLLGARFHG
jgi:23S rRNA (cytidine1920-2'-O)/16S rRNA (cytidine1409-2'-O)-methyltransferase